MNIKLQVFIGHFICAGRDALIIFQVVRYFVLFLEQLIAVTQGIFIVWVVWYKKRLHLRLFYLFLRTIVLSYEYIRFAFTHTFNWPWSLMDK